MSETPGGFDSGDAPDSPEHSRPEIVSQLVTYSLAMLAVREVDFTLTDTAIVLGETSPSFRDSIVQGVKRSLPLAKSRRQKYAQIKELQHGEALGDDRERTTNLQLTEWLGGLNDSERENVTLEDTHYGDPFLSPLRMVTRSKETETPKTFDLGYHLNMSSSPETFDSLPEAAKKRFFDREVFWHSFDVHNATELEAFIPAHFTKLPVDFAKGKIPSELRWLETIDRKTYRNVVDAQANNNQAMNFWRLKKTPDTVVDDILNISTNTQQNFISTWVAAWMKRQSKPTILSSDRQALHIARRQTRASIEEADPAKLSDFMRELLVRDLDQHFGDNFDFERSLANMDRLRSLTLGLEIEGETDVVTRTHLDDANELLDLDLSGEKASQRMMIDTVLRTSESIFQALKAIAVLVPSAAALQQVPISTISDFAEAVGPGDDVLRAIGEARSLHARGIRWAEIRRRFSFVLPVAIGAVALGTQIESIATHTDPRIAAITYAISTCMTTLATLGVTTKTYMSYYKRLADEGKIDGQPYLAIEDRQTLVSAATNIADIAETEMEVQNEPNEEATLILDALRNRPNIDRKELDARIQAILEAIRAGRPEQVSKHIEPSNLKVFSAAVKETFGINPLRRGSLTAIMFMPLAASGIGGPLLSSPLFFVPFGMGETFGALADAKITEWSEDGRWEVKVQTEIRRAQKRLKRHGGNTDA